MSCAPLPDSLHQHEEHRDEEDRQAGGGQHAGHHHGPQDLARGGARAAGDPERHAAEDEGERRHQDRPQAQPRALERGVDEVLPLLDSTLANSTIRIAFFAARPISIDEPDLRRRRRSRSLRSSSPRKAPKTATGTESSTLKGSDQLS